MVAIVFGVMFFALIYFIDKSRHEKEVGEITLQKEKNKKRDEDFRNDTFRRKIKVKSLMDTIAISNSELEWSEPIVEEYDIMNTYGGGYRKKEYIYTSAKLSNQKISITLMFQEEYNTLKITLNFLNKEKHGHSNEVLIIDNIIDQENMYHTFYEKAKKGMRDANFSYDPFDG